MNGSCLQLKHARCMEVQPAHSNYSAVVYCMRLADLPQWLFQLQVQP